MRGCLSLLILAALFFAVFVFMGFAWAVGEIIARGLL